MDLHSHHGENPKRAQPAAFHLLAGELYTLMTVDLNQGVNY